MNLIFLGKELDANKEHELISKFKHGFNAHVTYKLCYAECKTQMFHNLDEVHSLFSPLHNSIAFESSIHSNGGTRSVAEILSVVVTRAPRKYKDYWGKTTDCTPEECQEYYSR